MSFEVFQKNLSNKATHCQLSRRAILKDIFVLDCPNSHNFMEVCDTLVQFATVLFISILLHPAVFVEFQSNQNHFDLHCNLILHPAKLFLSLLYRLCTIYLWTTMAEFIRQLDFFLFLLPFAQSVLSSVPFSQLAHHLVAGTPQLITVTT